MFIFKYRYLFIIIKVPATVISQGGGKYTVTVNGEEHLIEGKLVDKPETNHEELVCSNISKVSSYFTH